MGYKFTALMISAALIILASSVSGQAQWYTMGHHWDDVYCPACIDIGDVDPDEIVTMPYLNTRLQDYATFQELDAMIAAALAGQPAPAPFPPPAAELKWVQVCQTYDPWPRPVDSYDCTENCGDYTVVYKDQKYHAGSWDGTCNPAQEVLGTGCSLTQVAPCTSAGKLCIVKTRPSPSMHSLTGSNPYCCAIGPSPQVVDDDSVVLFRCQLVG